jgi:hypothetical protein
MKLAVKWLFIVLVPGLLSAQMQEVTPKQSSLLKAAVVYNNRTTTLELKQLVMGSTGLYSYKNSVFFITVPGQSRFIHLPFHQEMREVDDGYVRKSRLVSTTFHIDTLLRYLPEKQFVSRIRSMFTINSTNLQALIVDYNRFIEDGILPSVDKNTVKTGDSDLKLLVSGKITLYQSGSGENQQFFIFREGHDAMIPLPVVASGHTQLNQNLAILSYRSYDKSYQDTLRKYMSDVPEIADQTGALGYPTAFSLSTFIRKYNAEFDTGFSLIKVMKQVKFSISPGIQYYNYIYHPLQDDSLAVFSGFMAGVSYDFGDFDLGFSTGILFPQLGFLNRYYKYPFRLSCTYHSGVVSPVIALSMISNSNEAFSFKTWSAGLGVDIRLFRNFSLSIFPEIEILQKDALTPIDERNDKPVLSIWGGLKISF